MTRPRISVVIRTTAASERRDMLFRALQSALTQDAVDVCVIVVVNSARQDSSVVSALEDAQGVRLVRLPEANLARATAVGRQMVDTPYFAYLDDDDELLPGALAARASFLHEHSQFDCVVTNGYYADGNRVTLKYPSMQVFEEDPAGAILTHQNWLCSCGALFRSSSVPQRFFDDLSEECEWTAIAFRIALELRLAFVDLPTFRINNTPTSESKTQRYAEGVPDAFSAMLPWARSREIRRRILRARAAAFHDAASYHRMRGDFRRAFAFHVRSVLAPGGWRYLPYALLLALHVRKPVADIAVARRFTALARPQC